MSKKNLPSIKELYKSDNLEVIQKDSAFQQLVNQPPKPEWLKLHPIHKKVVYIPIQRIEWLLTSIFIKWHVEIKEVKILANSVVTTIRLHYHNPVSDEWMYEDGVGASPIQTDKGTGAIDFNSIKSNAIMLATPASKSYAVKDAAELIGRLFGRDLNRADQIGYDNLANNFVDNIDPFEGKAAYIGVLLDNCTLPCNEIADIEQEITNGMSVVRADELIERLQNIQKTVDDKGPGGAKVDEINAAIKDKMDRDDS